jgi:hypothetical protein
MVEYNKNTTMDFTDGYDPKSLDLKYKEFSLYDRNKTEMPQTLDFAFDMKYCGIQFDSQDVRDLEEYFMKYQSENTTIIKPGEMLKTFKKHGIDKEKPSLFSMLKWICNANEFSGTDGMTFEEVLNYAAYFFS